MEEIILACEVTLTFPSLEEAEKFALNYPKPSRLCRFDKELSEESSYDGCEINHKDYAGRKFMFKDDVRSGLVLSADKILFFENGVFVLPEGYKNAFAFDSLSWLLDEVVAS